MIALPKGRKVRLDQLGTVSDGIAEQRTFATLDGKPIVAFAISRAKGASDTAVAAEVAEKIMELRRAHPDVEFKHLDSMVNYTLGAYRSDHEDPDRGRHPRHRGGLRVPARLARNIDRGHRPATLDRSGLLGHRGRGFSLNLVSLLAITIVTGILVDDAIVEIENIVRHMRMGKSAYRAALEAADEIGLAVIAITLTIIAVFVPVSFMGGIAGQYFKQFGLVRGIRRVFFAAGGAPHHAAARRLLSARLRPSEQEGRLLLSLHARSCGGRLPIAIRRWHSG